MTTAGQQLDLIRVNDVPTLLPLVYVRVCMRW